MATIYRDIGKFNQDITLHIEEASDKGKYSPYWKNIRELLALIDQNPDESEIVKLELYKLTLYSIETYARKFKADGIKEDDIRSVLANVKKSTDKLAVNADKTKAIKEDVTNRFGLTEKAVENAYRN
jgi:serine/threonine-protein kinase